MNPRIPRASVSRRVLITGGTGYLGRALIPALACRGHSVRALVRSGSRERLAGGADAMIGDPLQASDVAKALDGADTIVHLVGVSRPSPAKARAFRQVDLASVEALANAIRLTGVKPHVVYLSVAQPAPVMQAYVAVRAQGEALLRALELPASFVRPWYVLGPGHRWPIALLPVYALLGAFELTRESAERLGFVTLEQMTQALVHAVEHPPAEGVRIVDVPAIRATAAA